MDKVIKLTKIFLKNSFSNMDARMGISTKSKSKIIIDDPNDLLTIF